MEDQVHKPHRKSKEKKQHSGGLYHNRYCYEGLANSAKDRNPKAFAFANPGRLQRTAARSQDVGNAVSHV